MDILAIGDYKISSDERITLMHTYANDWSIGVQPVGEEDAGEAFRLAERDVRRLAVMEVNGHAKADRAKRHRRR